MKTKNMAAHYQVTTYLFLKPNCNFHFYSGIFTFKFHGHHKSKKWGILGSLQGDELELGNVLNLNSKNLDSTVGYIKEVSVSIT